MMRQNTYQIIDHDTNVGPVIPDGLPQHRRRKRDTEATATEIERTLHAVQRNLVRLIHQVPMVAIEDLPEEMQRHVVGLPRDWVQLFWWVAIVFLQDNLEIF